MNEPDRELIPATRGSLGQPNQPAQAGIGADWPLDLVGRRSMSWGITGLQIIAGFSAMVLASQIRVPVPGTDVPGTLQLLAVLLCGLMLSPGKAAAALTVFLGVGAAGVPVFSPGSAGFAGPTAGYLVGFLVAAVLVSVIRGRRTSASVVNTALVNMLAALVGMGAVFTFGVSWRAILLGNWDLALVTGLTPFLVKGLTELALAVAIATMFHLGGESVLSKLGPPARTGKLD